MQELTTPLPCRVWQSAPSGPLLYWMTGPQEQTEEVAAQLPDQPWTLVACPCRDWNAEYSPWPAPPVFGQESFAGHGPETLRRLQEEILPAVEAVLGTPPRRLLGGYSLAGLFSLWAALQTDAFDGVACCSGSLWYPGWQEFLLVHADRAPRQVALSLGKTEERTRNAAMVRVGDATRLTHTVLAQHCDCTLQWHPGGHFQNPAGRVACGFARLLG